MSPIPAVEMFEVLGSLLCYGLFGLMIAAAVWAGLKQARLQKGVEIPLDDVPPRIREAAERLVPNLEVSKVVVKYRRKNVPRKYEFSGRVDGKPIELELMPRDSPPFVREIEVIYEPSYERLRDERPVDISEVPVAAMQAALDHMESIGCPVKQIDRAKSGTIFDRKAYELNGAWKNGRVEIKLLADGEVIKVELKVPKKDRR